MTRDLWPWPADTALERARRIANSYRSALLTVAPDLCRTLDEKAVALGQSWVRPMETEIADLDRMMTADQIGELLTIDPRTVRMWGYRGHIDRLGTKRAPRYRLRDVVDHLARARQARQRDRA